MKIVHPILGELTFHYGWTKRMKLNIFDQEFSVEINIDADEDALFDENQIEAYQFFFKDLENRIQEAEKCVIEYFHSVVSDLLARDVDAGLKEKWVLAENQASEIFKFLTVKQILFPMNFDEHTREVGLICDCVWDSENGIGIKYIDENLSEIGFQDILL